jgi:hypothetical protein
VAKKSVQSKRYGSKHSKTYLAEMFFAKNKSMTNSEIAKILTNDVSKTTVNQVAMMRSRWKIKLQTLIAEHPEITAQTRKIITSQDFQNSFMGACVSISEQVSKRAETLKEETLLPLFVEVNKVVSGGRDA